MTRIIIRLIIRVSALCALLVLAVCTFGILQSSTEIAFVCDPRDSVYNQLCLTDADRGLMVPLTTNWRLSVDNITWSPDGKSIIFEGQLIHEPDANGNVSYERGLYRIDARGGPPRLLVPNGASPAWSHDGTQIAFSLSTTDVWQDGDLYTMPLNSGIPRLLLNLPYAIHNPTWSPDDTQIAFQAADTHKIFTWRIYRVRTNGSGVHLLTPVDTSYADPAWSPDGNKLALFWAGEWKQDVVLLDVNSGAQQDLSGNFSGSYAYDGSPTWSPDGKRIAFDSDGSRGYWQPQGWWIYIMQADGSGVYVVAQGKRPAWRPPRVFSWDDLVG